VHVRSFNHTGITVADFNRAVRFYWDVFGCPLVGVSDAPPDRVRGFFGVDAAVRVDHPTGLKYLDPLRAGSELAADRAADGVGSIHDLRDVTMGHTEPARQYLAVSTG